MADGSRLPKQTCGARLERILEEKQKRLAKLIARFLPQMSFPEDQDVGFMHRQLSSGSSEDHSSSDEVSSPCYSSGSEHIPPPPKQSPPPPPPLQVLLPPPVQFTDPVPPVRFSPEHAPRSRMPFQPHHPIIPPPPPPLRTLLSNRSPLHKVPPIRENADEQYITDSKQ